MDNNIFTEEFWINKWNSIGCKNRKKNAEPNDDTCKVHTGFSTPEYWDKASLTYDTQNQEIASRKLKKTIRLLKENDLIFNNCKVLEIGCGTGLLARELAEDNCIVTAVDFSQGMIERCKSETPETLKHHIKYLKKDWYKIDIEKDGWHKAFDLTIAFMSPAISTPESFFKMMRTTKKGCAIRGWAKKRKHDILDSLWEKIMRRPVKDKPQNFLYKLNLLFSMGYFPEITFDKVEWEEEASVEKEFHTQLAFFKKVSDIHEKKLTKIIKEYLDSIAENDTIHKKHKGLTATAFWHLEPDL